MFYSFIFRKFFTGDREQLISEFLAQNDENGTLEEEIRHRVENSKNYGQYLRENGLQIVDEEAQKRQKELLANFKVEMAKLNKNYRSTNQTRGCTH